MKAEWSSRSVPTAAEAGGYLRTTTVGGREAGESPAGDVGAPLSVGTGISVGDLGGGTA